MALKLYRRTYRIYLLFMGFFHIENAVKSKHMLVPFPRNLSKLVSIRFMLSQLPRYNLGDWLATYFRLLLVL